MTIVRDVTGNSTNVVMHELLVAARTDEKLRATLQDVLAVYVAKISKPRGRATAEELPAVTRTSPRWWRCWSTRSTAPRSFRHVLTQPEIEERRIPVLVSLLTSDAELRGKRTVQRAGRAIATIQQRSVDIAMSSMMRHIR